MTVNRSDALAAQTRLILAQTQKDTEVACAEVMQGAAARGQFNSGGTVRRLMNVLLEHCGRAGDQLISVRIRAGEDDAEQVATRVRDTLRPITDAFFSTYANRNAGAWPSAFEAMRPEVDELLGALLDKATVFLATYPRATEDIIAARVPVKLPASWDRVQRALEKAKSQLSAAQNEEDFQSVGLLCREVIISTGQAVYEPSRHPSVDGTTPSETDAKRQLDAYFAAELAGEANEPMRKHARAAFDLTVSLQHKRTATFCHAAVCLEATASVVSLVAIVSGTRGVG